MRRRSLLVAVALAVPVICLSPGSGAGQAPAAGDATFRTLWGDPDLQGIWSYATITPLQRPGDLVGREFLTAEEVAEQKKTPR